jgi:hypothetical protein
LERLHLGKLASWFRGDGKLEVVIEFCAA